MSQFVVTSGGTMTNLNERRSPSRTAALTGTTYPVGTVLTSLEQRPVFINASNGVVASTEVWHRLGTNRWVNESTGSPSTGGVIRNMIRTTKFNNPQAFSVSSSTGEANVRRGPGSVFTRVRILRNGTKLIGTHTATPPSGFPLSTGGAWIRIGNREWIYRPLIR